MGNIWVQKCLGLYASAHIRNCHHLNNHLNIFKATAVISNKRVSSGRSVHFLCSDTDTIKSTSSSHQQTTAADKGSLKDTFWLKRFIRRGHHYSCDRRDTIFTMENKGTRVRIQSKHGFSYSSLLSVEVIQDNLRVSWRTYPQKLGVDMLYLKELKRSLKSDSNIILIFQGKIRWCKLVVDKCVPRIMLTISEIEVVSWVIQCWSFSSALIIFIKNMRQQNLDNRIFKLHCTLSF